MKYLFILIVSTFCFCNINKTGTENLSNNTDIILKIEMNLSAFGVEADFPSINAYIDLKNDSSNCYKWFYNPSLKDSTYSLSKSELIEIKKILNKTDLSKLKTEYSVKFTDQPSSKTIIYTNKGTYTFSDY